MKFLLDVCASARSLRTALTDWGHDVVSAVSIDPRATDEHLLAFAHRDDRILITEDKDVGELVFVQKLPHGLPAPLCARLCCRPWLDSRTFNYGQLVVVLLTWKVASLIGLPTASWARFARLRLLAYCVWYGMQPQQFLKGAKTAPGAPVPTVVGFLLNVLTGAVPVWGVPRVLAAGRDAARDPLLDRARRPGVPRSDRPAGPLCAGVPRHGLCGREGMGLPDLADGVTRPTCWRTD